MDKTFVQFIENERKLFTEKADAFLSAPVTESNSREMSDLRAATMAFVAAYDKMKDRIIELEGLLLNRDQVISNNEEALKRFSSDPTGL